MYRKITKTSIKEKSNGVPHFHMCQDFDTPFEFSTTHKVGCV